MQAFVLRLPPQNKAHWALCSHYNAFCSITWLTNLSTHTATPDDNNHAAFPLRSTTAADSRNEWNYTHTHRNNHSLQNTEEEHIRDRNDRSRNRRTHEVPFIAGCNHFTRKNTRFRAPASSPKQSPLSIHADITMRFFVATSLRHRFP